MHYWTLLLLPLVVIWLPIWLINWIVEWRADRRDWRRSRGLSPRQLLDRERSIIRANTAKSLRELRTAAEQTRRALLEETDQPRRTYRIND